LAGGLEGKKGKPAIAGNESKTHGGCWAPWVWPEGADGSRPVYDCQGKPEAERRI
jgi:hypothetical protein